MPWRKTLLLLAGLSAVAVLVLELQRLAVDDSFVGDFEVGDLSQWDGASKVNTTNSRIEVVEEPVRRGRYAIKVTLLPNDDYPKDRAELVLHSPPGGSGPGDERYYAFSALIPEDFRTGAENFFILAQWHGNDSDLPPLAVHYHDGEVVLKGNRKRGEIWRGGVEKGKWFDLVFHIRWSSGEDGLLEAWKDGKKIVALRGKTCNGEEVENFKGPNIFVKFGGYRGRDVDIVQTVYLDEYRIGTNYAAVALEDSPR